MSKKLSQKQRGEVVTKGYFHDLLDEKDYVTKEYLDNLLESKNYVTKDFLKAQNYITKDFLMGEFKTTFRAELEIFIEDSFKRHVNALMEDNHDTMMMVIEAFQNRFERIESHLGLKY